MLTTILYSISQNRAKEARTSLSEHLSGLALDDTAPIAPTKQLSPLEQVLNLAKERHALDIMFADYLRDKTIPNRQKIEALRGYYGEKFINQGCQKSLMQGESINDFISEVANATTATYFPKLVEVIEGFSVRGDSEEIQHFVVGALLENYLLITEGGINRLKRASFDSTVVLLQDQCKVFKEMLNILKSIHGEPWELYIETRKSTHDSYGLQYYSNEDFVTQQCKKYFSKVNKLTTDYHTQLISCPDLYNEASAILNALLEVLLKRNSHYNNLIEQNITDFYHFLLLKPKIEHFLEHAPLTLSSEKSKASKNLIRNQKKRQKQKLKKLRERELALSTKSTVEESSGSGSSPDTIKARSLEIEADSLPTAALDISEPAGSTMTERLADCVQKLEGKEHKKETPHRQDYRPSSSRQITSPTSCTTKAKLPSHKSMLDCMKDKLQRGKYRDDYLAIFATPTPHEVIRCDTLEKIVHICGGEIESTGKTGGSRRRIKLHQADVWATLLDANSHSQPLVTHGGFHAPHQPKAKSWTVRSVRDALTRAGYTPEVLLQPEGQKRKSISFGG